MGALPGPVLYTRVPCPTLSIMTLTQTLLLHEVCVAFTYSFLWSEHT